MSYRYDMRDKSKQAQEIVRRRDKVDELLKKKPKRDFDCSPSPRLANYEGVYFRQNGINILELRISGTAIANGPCQLSEVDIHKWLCKTGRTFINQVKEYQILMITSYDVAQGELITDWKRLRREVDAKDS